MILRPQIRIWGLEVKHLKAHNFVWQGCFFLSLSYFDDQLSLNFQRFVILCICWDTPTVKTSLWQLPIVSSVFKKKVAPHTCTLQEKLLNVWAPWASLSDRFEHGIRSHYFYYPGVRFYISWTVYWNNVFVSFWLAWV